MARILGDGKRQRMTCVQRVTIPFLFEDRFGRPGKAERQGRGRGDRRLSPGRTSWCRCQGSGTSSPQHASSKQVAAPSDGRNSAWPRPDGRRTPGTGSCGSSAPSRESPDDACDKRPGRVSSLSLVRYRGTDYSVPLTVRPFREAAGNRGYSGTRWSSVAHRRGDCQAPAFIRQERLRLRSAALSVLAGAKDQRAGSGGSLGRAGCCRRCSAISAAYLKRVMGKAGKRARVQGVLRLIESFSLHRRCLEPPGIGWRSMSAA